MTLTIVFMSGLFLCRFHADAIRVIVLPHPPPHPMYYCLFIMLPHPHTIREKIRQYNHHSSLELPHYIYIYIYIYISIRLKYSLQKFGLVYVNYVNEHKNSGTKSSQTKQRLWEPIISSSTTL